MKSGIQGATLGLLVFLAGCQDKTAREVREIETSLEAFPQKMTEDENILVRARALNARLKALDSPGLRRGLFAEWADAVYSFDLMRIPLDNSPRFEWVRKFVYDFSITNHENRPWSFTEEWDARLRYLAWLKRQTGLMRIPADYPDGIRMVTSQDGNGRWHVSQGMRSKLREYLCRLGRYRSCADSYESMLTWWERDLVGRRSSEQGEAREEVERLERRLADFLGRELRTRDECNSDFDERRHREFPYLVPTMNGLVKCWTQAEVERARQKPASYDRDDAVMQKSKRANP